jgi:hypothetical protein
MRYKFDEQYKNVLDKMPSSFSTFEINKVAKKVGIPNEVVSNGYSHRFLSRYANRTGTSTWSKKEEQPKEIKTYEHINKSLDLMNDYDIYKSVLELMPARFSSLQFATKAREFGAGEFPIRQGFIGSWLQSNPKVGRITFRKWYKLDELASEAPIFNEQPQEVATQKPTEPTEPTPIREEEAVELLKSLGYRLMKPTTQWEEL